MDDYTFLTRDLTLTREIVLSLSRYLPDVPVCDPLIESDLMKLRHYIDNHPFILIMSDSVNLCGGIVIPVRLVNYSVYSDIVVERFNEELIQTWISKGQELISFVGIANSANLSIDRCIMAYHYHYIGERQLQYRRTASLPVFDNNLFTESAIHPYAGVDRQMTKSAPEFGQDYYMSRRSRRSIYHEYPDTSKTKSRKCSIL